MLFIIGYESNFNKYDATVIQTLGAPYDYGKSIRCSFNVIINLMCTLIMYTTTRICDALRCLWVRH